MSRRRKLVVVGLGSTTESALRGLIGDFDVRFLLRPVEPDDVAVRLARQAGAKVVGDTSVKSLRSIVEQFRPDCVVVSSYDKILPPDIVSSVPFINVHYAPLPRYRGRATVNWAIINGEPYTAVTVHELLPALDAGGILFQETVSIGRRDNVTDLYRRLNTIQQRVLAGAVDRLLAGDHGIPQDESRATYVCTRTPEDGEISWAESAESIDRTIRALTSPFPGAFTWLDGLKVVVNSAEPVDSVEWEGIVPGRVANIDRETGDVDVFTGSGVLRLKEIAVAGRVMAPVALVSSSRCTLGTR